MIMSIQNIAKEVIVVHDGTCGLQCMREQLKIPEDQLLSQLIDLAKAELVSSSVRSWCTRLQSAWDVAKASGQRLKITECDYLPSAAVRFYCKTYNVSALFVKRPTAASGRRPKKDEYEVVEAMFPAVPEKFKERFVMIFRVGGEKWDFFDYFKPLDGKNEEFKALLLSTLAAQLPLASAAAELNRLSDDSESPLEDEVVSAVDDSGFSSDGEDHNRSPRDQDPHDSGFDFSGDDESETGNESDSGDESASAGSDSGCKSFRLPPSEKYPFYRRGGWFDTEGLEDPNLTPIKIEPDDSVPSSPVERMIVTPPLVKEEQSVIDKEGSPSQSVKVEPIVMVEDGPVVVKNEPIVLTVEETPILMKVKHEDHKSSSPAAAIEKKEEIPFSAEEESGDERSDTVVPPLVKLESEASNLSALNSMVGSLKPTVSIGNGIQISGKELYSLSDTNHGVQELRIGGHTNEDWRSFTRSVHASDRAATRNFFVTELDGHPYTPLLHRFVVYSAMTAKWNQPKWFTNELLGDIPSEKRRTVFSQCFMASPKYLAEHNFVVSAAAYTECKDVEEFVFLHRIMVASCGKIFFVVEFRNGEIRLIDLVNERKFDSYVSLPHIPVDVRAAHEKFMAYIDVASKSPKTASLVFDPNISTKNIEVPPYKYNVLLDGNSDDNRDSHIEAKAQELTDILETHDFVKRIGNVGSFFTNIKSGGEIVIGQGDWVTVEQFLSNVGRFKYAGAYKGDFASSETHLIYDLYDGALKTVLRNHIRKDTRIPEKYRWPLPAPDAIVNAIDEFILECNVNRSSGERKLREHISRKLPKIQKVPEEEREIRAPRKDSSAASATVSPGSPDSIHPIRLNMDKSAREKRKITACDKVKKKPRAELKKSRVPSKHYVTSDEDVAVAIPAIALKKETRKFASRPETPPPMEFSSPDPITPAQLPEDWEARSFKKYSPSLIKDIDLPARWTKNELIVNSVLPFLDHYFRNRDVRNFRNWRFLYKNQYRSYCFIYDLDFAGFRLFDSARKSLRPHYRRPLLPTPDAAVELSEVLKVAESSTTVPPVRAIPVGDSSQSPVSSPQVAAPFMMYAPQTPPTYPPQAATLQYIQPATFPQYPAQTVASPYPVQFTPSPPPCSPAMFQQQYSHWSPGAFTGHHPIFAPVTASLGPQNWTPIQQGFSQQACFNPQQAYYGKPY